jgi:hypothetical protein
MQGCLFRIAAVVAVSAFSVTLASAAEIRADPFLRLTAVMEGTVPSRIFECGYRVMEKGRPAAMPRCANRPDLLGIS